ncbi:MAG: hypothetical protein OXG97_13830 [Candidatus Poribacteria bacterium]|nr:hypothetical protein [Candidatus Poribacteria bacterium]
MGIYKYAGRMNAGGFSGEICEQRGALAHGKRFCAGFAIGTGCEETQEQRDVWGTLLLTLPALRFYFATVPVKRLR